MLKLTRRRGENLIIETAQGEKITVRVLEMKEGSARIGVEAPHSMSVDREEVYERKQLEKVS